VGLSWILGAFIYVFAPVKWIDWLWGALPIFAYSTVGNFALFFELGVGLYLDGRARLGWLMPLLLLSFVMNTLICSWALLDLCFSKVFRDDKRHVWFKTLHNGGGS